MLTQTQQEFISYEQALELKELGFDDACLARHIIITEWEKPTGQIILQMLDCLNSDKYLVKAPLYQQAFRWFRKKYGLHHEIKKEKGINDSTHIFFVPITQSGLKKKLTHTPQHTYEEAELECLKKLIEIVKTQNLQQSMYSEEEVFKLLCAMPNFFNMTIAQQTLEKKEWFEQFKK